jgi:hypothetical protein
LGPETAATEAGIVEQPSHQSVSVPLAASMTIVAEEMSGSVMPSGAEYGFGMGLGSRA